MRHRISDYLFTSQELSSTLTAYKDSIVEKVERIPRDQFLATSVDTLVDHLVAELSWEPLVIYEDQMAMDGKEAKVEVTGRFEYDFGDGQRHYTSGHELKFYLPYSGDRRLWQMRPNSYSLSPPRGELDVGQSRLVITLSDTSNTEFEKFNAELQSQLTQIRQLIQSQTQMLTNYHGELPSLVKLAIERRRTQLEKAQGLVAAFNIPLVRKDGVPEFKPIEIQRRIPRPLPRPAVAGYKPEPAINNELYEDILGVIRHAGRSFEGTPQTYKPHGEDGLRDIVLSHINAVYEGRATGETFRKYGKTDILLEEENRSAFIAECKLWCGEQLLIAALRQLQGYLTWRDCKSALIIFNKEVANFSIVQEKIAGVLPAHEGFLRSKDTGRAGEWRFVFQSKEDPAREITVHVFAFNLYVAPERATKKR